MTTRTALAAGAALLAGWALALAAIADVAGAATLADLERARAIARTVVQLPAEPTARIGGMDPRNADAAAEADHRGCLDSHGPHGNPLRCETRYDPYLFGIATAAQICSIEIHERQHLGGWYIPGQADPHHSLDPRSNMYPAAAHHPACGLSEDQRAALTERVDALTDRLDDLRSAARRIRRACGRVSAARRRPCARRAQRLDTRVRRYSALLRAARARPRPPLAASVGWSA